MDEYIVKIEENNSMKRDKSGNQSGQHIRENSIELRKIMARLVEARMVEGIFYKFLGCK
jgi:hypothetical protein